MSSANLATNNADGNAEIFVANFSGSAIGNIRQVTRTQNSAGNTNVWSAARRLSRDAHCSRSNRAHRSEIRCGPTNVFLGTFVYTVSERHVCRD